MPRRLLMGENRDDILCPFAEFVCSLRGKYMNTTEIKKRLDDGEYDRLLSELYPTLDGAKKRISEALSAYARKYGEEREVIVLSVPGRTEICGNHTDHQRGKVLAGSIDRDIIAVASRREDGMICVKSANRSEDRMTVRETDSRDNFAIGHSASLIAGVVNGFSKQGYEVGGFDAYTLSDVPAGSGLSSSAAFEGIIGTIINHLYLGGEVDNREIAKIGQYAENVYFNKPSGLLDQMACAVGGAVYMDFANKNSPIVEHIDLPLSDMGYCLCITATGGSHADLGEDYASVSGEMRAVAELLGCEVLSEVDKTEFCRMMPTLRESLGDRAVLRSLHYFRECDRVTRMREAIIKRDMGAILSIMRASGHSSFEYLQNVYTSKRVTEQGLSLALALTEGYIWDKAASCRVHGGGFAGTIQALIPKEDTADYVALMSSVFGARSVMVLNIRPIGATRLI